MAFFLFILIYVGTRVLEIIDSFAENGFSVVLLIGLLWAFFRVRQRETRLGQLSSQQTNLVDARVSLEAQLTAVKADISWLSEDCFKTPRPVKL